MNKGQVFKFPSPSGTFSGYGTKGRTWAFNKGQITFNFIDGTANGHDLNTIEPTLFTNTLPHKLQTGQKVRSLALYCEDDIIFSLGSSNTQKKHLIGGKMHIFENIEIDECSAEMQEDAYPQGAELELFYSLDCIMPMRFSEPIPAFYRQRSGANLTDTDATVFLKKTAHYYKQTLILTSATNGATYTIQVQNNDAAGAWVNYQAATAIAAGDSAIVQIEGVFYRTKVIAKNTVGGSNASLSGSLQGVR